MKRLLGSLIFVLLTSHAYAQDVDFGAFGDAGNLLSSNAPSAAARGAASARAPARAAAPAPPPPDRLVRLRDALVKAESPMTMEQETELNKLLDAEIPAMRKTLQTHGQQMLASRPPGDVTPPSAAPAPGTSRAAPPSSRVPAEVLDALEVEMRQMNDALFGKIAAAPALNSQQQSVLTKMARNQIRSRGGFDALRISMEDAGVPFTEDQLPKVQALFEEQKKSREALAKESQGTPDAAKLKQLENDTLMKVVGLLVPAQRTAILRAPK